MFHNVSWYFQQHTKKKKKEKKEKREKKDKKKKKDRLKAEYEEAEGITTPSKERLTPTQLDTPVATKVGHVLNLASENILFLIIFN